MCRANGDGNGTAACDANFTGVHASAPDIIACAHQSCNSCYAQGTLTCKLESYACRDCLIGECAAEVGACQANNGCASALGGYNTCVCAANEGTGSVEACNEALAEAGAAPASTLLDCVGACAGECGL